MNNTLICEDSFDGMMTAVYDGWVLMNQGHSIHIHPGELYDYSFFTEYINIDTDLEKSVKVAESIRKKISVEAYMLVFRACMHFAEDRVDAVVGFLKQGYRVGGRITKDFGNPVVMRVTELARKSSNEAHLFKEFIRFQELQGNILYGCIAPKCDVLPLVEQHFHTRFPLENWIIYDENRRKALVHQRSCECVTVSGADVEARIKLLEREDDYEALWKVFFEAIGIKERENYKCQRNHLPKWYRKHMTEMEE